jgi:hypothetical protein
LEMHDTLMHVRSSTGMSRSTVEAAFV